MRIVLVWLLRCLPLLVVLGLSLAALPPIQAAPTRGAIAYVYRGDGVAAESFAGLLSTSGFSVTLVPLATVISTTLSTYNLIIVADDTGSLESWGPPTPPATADVVAKLTGANRPILGLGEGGYAFFGQLHSFIGWPNGWHGPLASVTRAPNSGYFSGPNPVGADPVTLYSEPVNEVAIYLGGAVPSDVLPFGLEDRTAADHAPLIIQGCQQLWGFSGAPTTMTSDGKNLFVNAVSYASTFQCSPPTVPSTKCFDLSKSADPPADTSVSPGQTISYTLTYTYSNSPNCPQNNAKPGDAKLVDTLPPDTVFVPGSASDDSAPAGDGALTWTIAPGASAGTKSFKVVVADSQCHNQRTVLNQASFHRSDGVVLTSNQVSHPVECPPVSLPNNDPPYAEQEVSVNPYPLVTGTPSAIKVRLTNSVTTTQVVTVSFQTSPQVFGIGLSFNTFDSKRVTIPAGGSVIVNSSFTPVASGHYCIQIKIEDANPTPQYAPIYTQRNLDVSEDLTPGKADNLIFKVANSTTTTATITLVVDNTCPGWTAIVTPTTLSAVGPNGSDVREATLIVTPPNPATLGSGCHIDVQGWANGQLLGGIRKLDVPPVQLPPNVDPPWLEPEISVTPTPPVAGQPAQICVELQNPLASTKSVTLTYAVADFGAGIGFTPVATKTVTLPPHSLAKYCADWTPSAGGTLHRCILITLAQAGYRDMHSQLNLDLRRVPLTDLATLQFPVRVRNPDAVTHTLTFVPTFYGIDPLWRLRFIGDPPPASLAPGQTASILIGLKQPSLPLGVGLAASTPTLFGDEARIDVAVQLDGQVVGGFTIQLANSHVFLPLIVR